MMKSILLFINLFATISGAMSLKERINRTEVTTLPFEYTNLVEYSRPGYSINGLQLTTSIPRYTYGDVGKKIRLVNMGHISYSLFKCFDSRNKGFVLLDIVLKRMPGENRHFLVTLDTNYQMIDTLEVAAGGRHRDRLCVKQYRLNSDFTLTVYDLRQTSDNVLRYQVDQFDSFEAQRVDTRYTINEEGKFVKGEEIRYTPRTYKMEELYQKGHGIWNGTETPVERENE